MPSQLLILGSTPSTSLEGMLHLVALQVGTMISFAVVAVREGIYREELSSTKDHLFWMQERQTYDKGLS
jgi:hypothetical protein